MTLGDEILDSYIPVGLAVRRVAQAGCLCYLSVRRYTGATKLIEP
jgi:hypothetical protein